MFQIRHYGIYVNNLEKQEDFYKTVFSMKIICSRELQDGELITNLFKMESVTVIASKLITEQGVVSGYGDMIELLEVLDSQNKSEFDGCEKPIFNTGCCHLALAVDNLEEIVQVASEKGGKLKTRIHHMGNGRKCCFMTDPEGNWIEMIE